MRTAIRKHLRDFVAISILVGISLVTTYVIVQGQRLRIPILEQRPFELKAEFETAQAVVPGQGQTIRIAGVRVGDVADVDLERGRGIVTFALDRDYLPVYRDATVLMRPTTGLKDMFFQLDPGTRDAGEIDEGGTIPVANTAPDVNLDEILEVLDADTRAYLRLLLVGAGQGLEGRDRDLGRVLGGLGPLNRDFAELNSEVAKRRENLARLIHSLNILTTDIGRSEDELTALVKSSETAVGAIAERDPDVQSAVSRLPGTLATAERALTSAARFASILGPAAEELRPFARNLEPMNAAVRELAEGATPAIREEIRPFVRAARPVVPDLREASGRYGAATPGLTTIARSLNGFLNEWSYNPNGAEPAGTPGRSEGYLYWTAWAGHVGDSLFSGGDAHGPMWRVYLTESCEGALSLISSADPELRAMMQTVTGLTDPVLREVGCI